jgi:hypothetical protein
MAFAVPFRYFLGMVHLFVANTDNAWFDFLSTEPTLNEVNFWWPGEMGFRALQPGELLVFRLKSPRNKIGGFGIFTNHSLLPVQIAWDSFGRANGVSSFEALRGAIAEYDDKYWLYYSCRASLFSSRPLD